MLLRLDALKFSISRTAAWRRSLAERFPGDNRNTAAADMLDALAKTPASEVDPALWVKVEPYMSCRETRQVVSAMARTVGFSQHPRDLNEFLPILLDALWDAVGDTTPPAGASLANVLPTAQVQR